MDIYFTNTLTGQKEKFIAQNSNKVKIYSCGPTVYDFAHIGNFRSFLMSDILVRILQYFDYKTIKVQNITDVGHLVSDNDTGEDKILKKARLEKKDPFAIAKFFENAFIEDETRLKILPPDHRPRATEYIPEQISLCEKLIKNEFAYECNGSVYFRTTKFRKYGQLSKNKLEDLFSGVRVEINSEKENPLDFAVWKKAEINHLMQWDSPWGRGFPGWHLECSAMSLRLLGEQFDIHTGGEDNIFPHHECEIAQNEASNGGKKSVNYWLHAKHLLFEGKKMSKSFGNFYTIRDLFAKGFSGETIRYLLISANYRTALNFTWDGLQMADTSLKRINEAIRIFKNITNKNKKKVQTSQISIYRQKYKDALADNLNTSDALGVTFSLIKFGLKEKESEQLTSDMAIEIVDFLQNDFNDIFAVLEPKKVISTEIKNNIKNLIVEREKLRIAKNWLEADKIRDKLQNDGIILYDENGQTQWKSL